MSNGWPQVTLGDILVQDREYVTTLEMRAYPKLSVKLYGKGVILDSPADASQLKMQRHQLAKAGQVILSEIWGKKGAIGFVPAEGEGALCTSHFFLFDVIRSQIEPGWLDAIFRANYLAQQLGATAFGTTGYAAVRPKDLLAATIPLPPLTEQRRIVAKVEELVAKIEEAKGLREHGIRESALLKYHQVGVVFDTLLNRYGTRTFGSFTPHVTSGPRSWGEHYAEEGLRFYRAQDIGPNGEILDKSKVYVQPPDGEQGRSAFLLAVGDVLIVITGATVGRCSVFSHDLEAGLVSQHVAICRFPKAEVDPAFVLWGLRGPQGQEQLFGQRYGQGKPGLNLTNIRQITLPIPPLSEQRHIVAYLDDLQAKVDSLKALQTQSAAELDALLPSILDKAFKGEL